MKVLDIWYDLVVKGEGHTYLSIALNANILTSTFESYVITATWNHWWYIHMYAISVQNIYYLHRN